MDKKRFIELWERCAKSGVDAHAIDVFNRLQEFYKQDHRFYHTPQHVQHCLNQVDLAEGELSDADAVELAIWFHDVIYDPQARDNEWQSTEWFRQCADGILSSELIEQVVRLILVTQHKNPPAKDDERFTVDVDLSGFALPWAEFIEESDAVRNEFSHQTDNDYAQRQIPFLQQLLNRDSIYSTEFFQKRYELEARENITRKIQILENMLN
ncbi:MAG: hypothetical protein OER96_08815 [Gammaproteobacteria bacterium]|nr:hypothetical protein [Gammaproteobacteria bacterium]